jgi:hypothetical protein
MRVARLVAAIHHYERLGLTPQWVLMVKKAGRARRKAAASEDVSWLPRDAAAAPAEPHTEDIASR